MLLSKMSLAKLALLAFATAGIVTLLSEKEQYIVRHMHGGFTTRTRVVRGKEIEDTRTFDPAGRLINHSFDDATGRKVSIDYDPETGEILERHVTE